MANTSHHFKVLRQARLVETSAVAIRTSSTPWASRGLDCLAVLDISGAALARAKTRLGSAAETPIWIEADVTSDWTLKPMDTWHDRAVFHFLTAPEDRAPYKDYLLQTLKRGGGAIIATFALDGPEKCSGLGGTLLAGTARRRARSHVRTARCAPARPHDAMGQHAIVEYSRFVRTH